MSPNQKNLMIQNADDFLPEPSRSALILAGNDDILFEILLRLPIRSLIKFKTVSKHWKSLITSSHFSRTRSSNISKATGLFLHRPGKLNPFHCFVSLDEDGPVNDPSRNLTFVNDSHGIRILQSCNGLLLCSTSGRVLKRNYYVYNPSTNQTSTLPHPNFPLFRDIHGEESIFSVHLAFDPARSPYYKAVCVHLSDMLGDKVEVEVYSSETGLWKNCVKGLQLSFTFSWGVFWNGAINWMPGWGDSFYFNVDEEYLGKLPSPSIAERLDPGMIRYFGESHGHLHLVAISGASILQFSIYEVDKNYSGWLEKYHVDLEAVMTTFSDSIYSHQSVIYGYPFHISSIVRGQNDEESFLIFCIHGKVISYDICNKKFRKLCDMVTGLHGLRNPFFPVCSAFQFIECLSSV